MTGIEEALRYHIVNATAVAFDVGDRCYPNEAPQKAKMPYVVYQRIDTVRERHLRGSSGLAHPRFQLDIYSRNYDEARRIANNLRLTLDARRSFDMGPSGQTVNIRSIELVDEAHDALPPADGTEKGIRHVRMDFIIWHVESVPVHQ